MPALAPLPPHQWPDALRVLSGAGSAVLRQSPDNGRKLWRTLSASWEGPDAPPWAFGVMFADRAVSQARAVFYCQDQAGPTHPVHQVWVWMLPQTDLLLVLLAEQAPAGVCSDVGLIDWTTTHVNLGLWDRNAGASPKGWTDWAQPLTDAGFDFWDLVADQRGRQPLEALAGVGRVKLSSAPVSARAQQVLDVVDVALTRQRLLEVQGQLNDAQQQLGTAASALGSASALTSHLLTALARRSTRHHHHAKRVRRLQQQLRTSKAQAKGALDALVVSGALDAEPSPELWDGWIY